MTDDAVLDAELADSTLIRQHLDAVAGGARTIPAGYGARRMWSCRLLAALAGSLAVTAAGQPSVREPTPESGIGVWYAPGAPADGALWRPGDTGQRLFLRGRVLAEAGTAVDGALVEIWHADSEGVVHPDRYRAALRSRRDGAFEISTVLPGYIWGPRHIHVVVTHPDHPRFITRIFFKRDPVVAESERPDLAIPLEDGRLGDAPTLLGEVEIVLKGSGLGRP